MQVCTHDTKPLANDSILKSGAYIKVKKCKKSKPPMKGLRDYGEKHLVVTRIHKKKTERVERTLYKRSSGGASERKRARSELESLGKGI